MRLEIEIDTRDEKAAKAVAEALSSDSRTRRGKSIFSSSGTKLLMEMEYNDKVALRAAVNSSLRVADSCLSILR